MGNVYFMMRSGFRVTACWNVPRQGTSDNLELVFFEIRSELVLKVDSEHGCYRGNQPSYFARENGSTLQWRRMRTKLTKVNAILKSIDGGEHSNLGASSWRCEEG